MKIRQGFVSNSSSSSFCLIANSANLDEFVDHIVTTFPGSFDLSMDKWDLYTEIESFVMGLTNTGCYIDPECEIVYLGLDLESLEKKEYYKTIETLIKETNDKIEKLKLPKNILNGSATITQATICN